MPQTREFRALGRRYLLANLLSILPFIPVFIFMWLQATRRLFDGWFWLAVAIFLAGAAFGLWWQGYRARRTICPKCGELIILTTHVPAGQPTDFICTRCDIMWLTGLSTADD